MRKEECQKLQREANEYYSKAHIVLTPEEKSRIEVADFGLEEIRTIGLESVVYINTERCCAKEMVLFPRQTCPEHIHPPVGDCYEGKEETFRCRWGTVYLYVEGEPAESVQAAIPENAKEYFTVFHEIVLREGEQYTLYPGTRHWFQAGEEGAVVSEFSTHCFDEYDVFTDPRIKRIPDITE